MEGNGAIRLIKLMKQHGYNKDIDIELATVTNPPPKLKIQIDNMKIELEADDLIVAQHLTKHKRYVTMKKSIDSQFESYIKLKSTEVSESMSSQGYIPHTHDITSITLDNIQNDFAFENIEMEFQDELKKGDRIIVASVNDGQKYIILDRAVTF
jgi:PIN domain nuclease of toxin-antitoxin system